MNDMDLQKIIDARIADYMSRKQYQLSRIPNHTHNGTDSPKISQNNVIPTQRIGGSVTFAQEQRYTIGLSFNPTNVQVYGLVRSTDANVRAIVVGSAFLGPSFTMQPDTLSSTKVGSIQPITQGSTYLWTNRASGGEYFAAVSQEHIVSVYNGAIDIANTNLRARATVVSFENNALIIDVTRLTSGYEIILQYMVS